MIYMAKLNTNLDEISIWNGVIDPSNLLALQLNPTSFAFNGASYDGTINIVEEDLTDLKTEQDKLHNIPCVFVTLQIEDEDAIDITPYLSEVPIIDRQKNISVDSVNSVVSADAVFTVSNETYLFSTQNESGLFYDKDYFNSKIIVFTGFWIDGVPTVTPQLIVYLREVRLETEKNTVKLICQGKAKKIETIQIGAPLSDGTENPLTYSGTWTFNELVEDLLVTYGELVSDDFYISDISGLSFTDLTFTDTTLVDAVGYLCQIAGCEMYEDRLGRLSISKFELKFGGASANLLKDTTNIIRLFVHESLDYVLTTLKLTGEDSDVYYEATGSNDKGEIKSIENIYVQTTDIAEDVVTNYMERYGDVPLMVEVDVDFMPTVDIGDIVKITDTQSKLTSTEFEVYRVMLDLVNLKSTLYLIQSTYNVNFGFFASSTTELSDANAPQSSDYDTATDYDKLFGYFGDRTVADSTPPTYVYSRR